jgi:hypothetical protein
VQITQRCRSRTQNLKEHSRKDNFSQETECSQTSSNQGSEAAFCTQQEENRKVTSSADAASEYVHIEHQVTLNASDSINAKTAFEQMAKDVGVDVMGYHTDNGIYTSKSYVENLVQNQQSLRHSRV